MDKLLKKIKKHGIKKSFYIGVKYILIILKKIIITVKNLTIKFSFSFLKYYYFKKMIKSIEQYEYKDLIVFENNFGWNNIMKQRPQQIANHFNKDVLFLYGSYRNDFKHISRIEKMKSNLFVIDLNIYGELLIKYLNKRNINKYLMIYSTDYIPIKIIDKYYSKNFKIIYEYVDDIDEKLCGIETSKLLKERHKKLSEYKDIYFIATATKLYNNLISMKKDIKVKLITNGCDFEHFFNISTTMPKSMKKIKKGINIGYYGAIANWFDYDLINKLALKNSKYNIILIGVDYDNTLKKSKILQNKNVYYLGKKDYEELPRYLNEFDIAIIPFIINDITLSTSPVKVFEYMAAKKPIVTTALPECKKYKSIFIGEDHDDFIKNIEKAIKNRNNKNYLKILEKEALENAWSHKCEEMIKFIGE